MTREVYDKIVAPVAPFEEIEAKPKMTVEIVTHGRCMFCGKELTEGLFFCKECETKTESEE